MNLSALLAPFLAAPLSDAQLSQVSAYLELLLRWNARMNLTAVRDPEHIVIRHFGESFFAARQLFPAPVSDTARVVDVGSGAGFPGIPLKIFAPGIALTLIESNQKKSAFLKEVARALSLTNVNIFSGRAEHFPSTADLVTLRAVERYEQVLETASRLVLPGGRLALLIGATQAEHTPQLLSSFSWQPPIPIPQSTARVILLGTNQHS